MPVLQQNEDGSGYTLRAADPEDDDRETVYDLRPEGSQILLNVYGVRVGGQVDRDTLERLVGLRLATLRPAPPPEPEREPPPPPPPPPSPPVTRSAAEDRPLRPRDRDRERAPRPEPGPTGAGPVHRSTTPHDRPSDAPRPGVPRMSTAASPEPRSTSLRHLRRTRAREVALQVLYQVEQNPGFPQAEVDLFLRRRLQEPKLVEFARGLVGGVKANAEAIDGLITEVAENWRLDRMAAIDRNILRLGAFEMLFDAGVPAKVAINEALELAKRYSTAQSSRFVNGILDRLLTHDAARKAAAAGPGAAPGSADEASSRADEPTAPEPEAPPIPEPPRPSDMA